MIIDIESGDIGSTFQHGMTEKVKIQFLQQLTKYVATFLKKIRNQDYQLFEKTYNSKSDIQAKLTLFMKWNSQKERFATEQHDYISYNQACDTLLDFIYSNSDKFITKPL